MEQNSAYRSIYEQMADEASASIRNSERRAFDRSIVLLKIASERSRGSREWVEALLFVTRLWTILMEDLAHPGNGLPDGLKADLISIGIWILRHAEAIRQGQSSDFAALIDVSCAIRNGLQSS